LEELMDERSRSLAALQRELLTIRLEHRSEEVAALQRARESLQRSHTVLGKMLRITNAPRDGETRSS
jgi:hypothetical protein